MTPMTRPLAALGCLLLFACEGDGGVSPDTDAALEASQVDTDGQVASPDLDVPSELTEPTSDASDTVGDDLHDAAIPDTDVPSDASADTAPDVIDTDEPERDTSVLDTIPIDAAVVDTSVVDTPDTTADTLAPDLATPLCPALSETHPVVPSAYVPVCSEVSYPTDPPTSGPHYPVWATYKNYLAPVHPGFLVHSIKHGAVVITWHCPEGCDADLVALRERLARRPRDPACDALLHHRIIVAPRPGQDRRLVAWAWGASWKADCFDLDALSAFIDDAYGHGLEDDCFDGVDIEKVRTDSPWYCPP